jgi:flagellar basal body-associated protein FliL
MYIQGGKKPMDEQKKPNDPKKDDKKPKGNIWVALLISVVVILLLSTVYNAIMGSQYKLTTYSDFADAMATGKLAEVELHADRIIYLKAIYARFRT